MPIKITKKQYIQKLNNNNIKIKLVGVYTNMKTKTEHICICGKYFKISPSSVLKGNKCGCGYNRKNKRQSYFEKDYLLELLDKNIKIKPLGLFINKSTKTNHKCICGNKWLISPRNVLKDITCGCKRIPEHIVYIKKLKDKSIEVIPLEKYIL